MDLRERVLDGAASLSSAPSCESHIRRETVAAMSGGNPSNPEWSPPIKASSALSSRSASSWGEWSWCVIGRPA